VVEIMSSLSRERAQTIGTRGLARVLRDHTYASRAKEVDRLLRAGIAAKRRVSAA
jgi:hypothetical protein